MKSYKFLFFSLLISLLSYFPNLKGEIREYYFTCDRRAWEEGSLNGCGFPCTWLREIDHGEGCIEIQTVIACYNPGYEPCPKCQYSIVVPNDDPIFTQEFINHSCQLMEDYAVDKFTNGTLSGNQSFDTHFNNYTIYRTVTWVGDSTDVEIYLSIIPYMP